MKRITLLSLLIVSAIALTSCEALKGFKGGVSVGTEVNGTPVNVGVTFGKKHGGKTVVPVQPSGK